ncbi:MAG: ATP-binding protein [Hydrogenophaga sp.]|uniref:ATP-binding protein n=1 Tax=Hydrogenophaga sp. TaxID=1904254 RepID=UPI002728C577|nr:ATP-binding protein [Hydrogenophaga sp.]MDO9571803.1 ATP-binding protein [Hydrogenophaga sp.]
MTRPAPQPVPATADAAVQPDSGPTPRKRLTIGLQTLSRLMEDGCYYADKSGFAVDLAQTGTYYFLSRPRRFGKSLFLDTLKEMFEGNKALFKGLAAENRWDWTKKHPVIRISFGDGVLQSRAELDERIRGLLLDNQRLLGVTCTQTSTGISGQFSELIAQVHQASGQRVVVLIDECDKPVRDNIADSATASKMRMGLMNLYSVLKDANEHLKFVLLTGVSKFSTASMFSGLNNLQDITLDPRYSGLCGFTDNDVDTVFAPELPGLDREEIRRWYNGYNWLGERVYNPFDVLELFHHRVFTPDWVEADPPAFLIQLLAERQVFTPKLGQAVGEEGLLSTLDVDDIVPEALMFQAGYLTVDSVRKIPGRQVLTLKYPNKGVQASMNSSLLKHWCGGSSIPGPHISQLYDLLLANDLPALQPLFHAFFATIPRDWYRNSPIAQYEGYYASIFYSHFAALGLDIRLEDATNQGRIDMAVLFNGYVYIFEFKAIDGNPQGKALEQIKNKHYAEKYRARGEPIHLIGVEFNKASRNIVGFEVEAA